MYLLIRFDSARLFKVQCDLHSIMYLLIRVQGQGAAEAYLGFTFHNVSINSNTEVPDAKTAIIYIP